MGCRSQVRAVSLWEAGLLASGLAPGNIEHSADSCGLVLFSELRLGAKSVVPYMGLLAAPMAPGLPSLA